MALLQISEPGQSPEPHQRKRAVGIDLGTTNSLVATILSGTPTVLDDDQGRGLLPSVVHYAADGSIEVGFQAKQFAGVDPLNTISSVKRYLGRGLKDVALLGTELPYELVVSGGGMPNFKTAAGNINPVSVSARILEVLEQRAKDALGGSLDGAVITVPAYFDEAQRQATKDAATLAGIKVLRLLSEPTAAAIAYGLDKQDESTIAVFDLGGGTFDISILRLSKGVFEVLATGGDSSLGGDDFDRSLALWIAGQAGLGEQLDAARQQALMTIARSVKEKLTGVPEVEVEFENWHAPITRDFFNALIDPLLDKALQTCKRTLRDAKLKTEDIDNVVMVGGSTRTPRVRQRVAELFGREPHVDIDPDRVVALGAAIQADILVGNKPGDEMLLLDVIPLSLGLETMGGLMEKIIHRNTTIPVAKAQEFTTFKDGQTAMAIHVLQGERELVENCRSLARFELTGIPPKVAGAARVEVKFKVDTDGLLQVTAREITSGVEAHVEVKPSYGLNDDQITEMLKDSYTHAKDDMQLRALREQQVEAERVLEDLEAALKADGRELLDNDEYHCLEVAMDELRQARLGTDHRQIARHIEALGRISEEFAARRMNKSIRQALAGKQLDELDAS